MSSSEVLSNLNIRKFPSRASFNAASPDPNDLCVVAGEGKPLAQVTSLPTASAELEGEIYQYVGPTASPYQNGFFYKCKSSGGGTPTYSWQQTNVQFAVTSINGYVGAVDVKTIQGNQIVGSLGNVEIYKVPTSVPDLLDTDWVLDSGTGKYNQTINVTGVTATNTVFVSPLPASADDWASSNILCTAQGAGTLTFTCDTVPSTSGGWIGVNVVIFG